MASPRELNEEKNNVQDAHWFPHADKRRAATTA